MDNNLIQTLFYETNYYKTARKECLSDLRSCYEKYSKTYISAPDFVQGLKDLGYSANSKDVFKLRMRKTTRKEYFGF